MQITSSAFKNDSEIPVEHTCLGDNLSPPLIFLGIPEGTKSLALVVEDIDSAAPQPWVHWLVFDIPPSTTTAAAGEVPKGGIEGLANGGTPGYEGPCPRYFSGTHRYSFTLYALDQILGLPPIATKPEVLALAKDHTLARAQLMGTRTSKASSANRSY